MSLGILHELQFFGMAFLRGMLILVIYDLIRIFRRIVVHRVWSISIEDILYWIVTAVLIFQLLYRENDGAVRGYALLAVALGMLLYHQLLSDHFVRLLSRILKGVLAVLGKPFRMVFGKVVQVIRMGFRFGKKKLKKQVKEFIMILFS